MPLSNKLWVCHCFACAMAMGFLVALAGCEPKSTGNVEAMATKASTGPVDPPPKDVPSPPVVKKDGATPPRPKLKPGAKTVVLPKAGDRPYDKTFDDLRFEMTVGEKFVRSMLTKEVESLNGQRIRIRGYILPTPQMHGIKQFVLVRDNKECCFGPGAALFDCILVEMKPGTTANYTIQPIAVDGRFEVHEFVVGEKAAGHLSVGGGIGGVTAKPRATLFLAIDSKLGEPAAARFAGGGGGRGAV